MRDRVILLVEDNPNDQMLGRRALQRQGIASEVVTVGDGAEALEYLFGNGRYLGRDANRLPALILLDLNLPKVSGLEVLRRMRAEQRTRVVPVVILTSSAEEADIAAGYDRGCNSYIRKPVDYREFHAAVGALARYWLDLNVPPVPRQAALSS